MYRQYGTLKRNKNAAFFVYEKVIILSLATLILLKNLTYASIYYPVIFFCVCLIFSAVLMAQKSQYYEILVRSGKFVPEQNAKTVTGNLKIFTDSRFLNKHYLVIQFASLPTNVEKQALKNAGIQLIDYIPNNAFAASVSAGIDLTVLKISQARSIFNFTTAQKTIATLLQGNFPGHAVKSNGTTDLTITTYEKLSTADVASSFNALGATMLQELPMFKNFVIRIPQQNFTKLVASPLYNGWKL